MIKQEIEAICTSEMKRLWRNCMKASQTSILKFMHNAGHFSIPIYQRNYSWSESQCKQLWKDIIYAGSNNVNSHFIGSIVCVTSDDFTVSGNTPCLIIDGQQRITTITLILAILEKKLGKDKIEDLTSKRILNNYLIDEEEEGDSYYRYIPAEIDRQSLFHILGGPEPACESVRIKENYDFFQDEFNKITDISVICRGIQKLQIVDITLERGKDNPQLIFESMNSTGLDLSQADLIRNYLLMNLKDTQQRKLYKYYWKPMEEGFGQEAYRDYFDTFMRHYLIIKTNTISKIEDIYLDFKRYAQEISSEEVVSDLKKYAQYYCDIIFIDRVKDDKNIIEILRDMKNLKMDVVYPIILKFYADYKENIITKDDFIELLKIVESYIFRRAVCNLPSHSLAKTFLAILSQIKEECYLDSVKVAFALLKNTQRFPSESEFIEKIQARDMYNFRLAKYWLTKLENHERKEKISIDSYSIEHIMPQNPNLNKQWKEDLGENWEAIHNVYLHRIGNLTLTGYNSEYQDYSFTKKCNMEKGFKKSPLFLNSSVKDEPIWNKTSIENRGVILAEQAKLVWKDIKIKEEYLKEHTGKNKKNEYTLDDHPYLSKEYNKDLFEALKREIIALSPERVSMDILKHYIAFKYETNFVDIQPLSTSFKMQLNMKFCDIDDPKGLVKDVTNIGHLGNGDCEIYLRNLNELPDVMYLIRQSYEAQIED